MFGEPLMAEPASRWMCPPFPALLKRWAATVRLPVGETVRLFRAINSIRPPLIPEASIFLLTVIEPASAERRKVLAAISRSIVMSSVRTRKSMASVKPADSTDWVRLSKLATAKASKINEPFRPPVPP